MDSVYINSEYINSTAACTVIGGFCIDDYSLHRLSYYLMNKNNDLSCTSSTTDTETVHPEFFEANSLGLEYCGTFETELTETIEDERQRMRDWCVSQTISSASTIMSNIRLCNERIEQGADKNKDLWEFSFRRRSAPKP